MKDLLLLRALFVRKRDRFPLMIMENGRSHICVKHHTPHGQMSSETIVLMAHEPGQRNNHHKVPERLESKQMQPSDTLLLFCMNLTSYESFNEM